MILLRTLLCLAGVLLAQASWCAPKVILAFDVDGVLLFSDIRSLDPEQQKPIQAAGQILQANGKPYRSAHGALECLKSIHHSRYQEEPVAAGLYSRYPHENRNTETAAILNAGEPLLSFVTGRQDVLDVRKPHSPNYFDFQPDFSIFEGRFKKPLGRVPGAETAEVILIDDDPGVALRGEENGLLWVRNASVDGEFTRIRGLLDLAMEEAVKQGRPLRQILWDLQWRVRPGSQLIEYRKDLAESDDVYIRGLKLLRRENPNFTIPASHLDPIRQRVLEKQRLRAPIVFELLDRTPRKPPVTVQSEPELDEAEDGGAAEVAVWEPGWMQKFASMIGLVTPINVSMERAPTAASKDLIGLNVGPGARVRLPSGEIFSCDSVIKKRGDSFVYVGRMTGVPGPVLLKVAADARPEKLRLIEDEVQGLRMLAEVGIAAVPLLFSGKGFVVKDFYDGISAETWVKERGDSAAEAGDPKSVQFTILMDQLIAAELYVTQFRPKDIIWRNGRWHIVNCGVVRKREFATPDALIGRYDERIQHRFGVGLKALCLEGLSTPLSKKEGLEAED